MSHTGERPHTDPVPLSYAPGSLGRQSILLQLGGGLGIAGFCIALLIFLGACFGFGAALYLSPLPLIMGIIGLVFTVVAGVVDEHAEGPAILAGLFINVGAIAGALLEMAAWRGWQIFVQ